MSLLASLHFYYLNLMVWLKFKRCFNGMCDYQFLIGSVVIKSCGAKEVSDFYPIFYNPVPDFVHEIDCVSEVVHPL